MSDEMQCYICEEPVSRKEVYFRVTAVADENGEVAMVPAPSHPSCGQYQDLYIPHCLPLLLRTINRYISSWRS